MNTKCRVFLAHDPGGYEVVFPVFQRFKETDECVELYCMGPAAKLNPAFAILEDALDDLFIGSFAQNIKTLITGTSWGNNAELRIIEKARAYGVTTVSLLDYWSNYALRLRNDEQKFIYPDYYIVMDHIARREAIEEGVPEAIIYGLGHPGLDSFVRLKHNNRSLPLSERKALFLSQPLSQLYGDSLGYTEQGVIEDCIKLFAALEWNLDIKFHPKDDAAFQKTYASYAVQGNSIDLIPQYSLVVSMSSMVLLHAVLLEVPAISYQPNLAKTDMCITNKLGLTQLAASYPALLELVENIQLRSDSQDNHSQISDEILWLDGCSTERIFSFIKEL